MKRMLKGGLIVGERESRIGDILMDEDTGKILQVADQIQAPADAQVVDVSGEAGVSRIYRRAHSF